MSTRLKIATLQLNPLIGALEDNIARANSILSLAFPANGRPDLLVLPEMALCGYNYSSPQHVAPVLESLSDRGPMLKWGEEVSKKYGCFTVLGYPELKEGKIFNSAIVFGKQGEVIHNYNKSFLYETDEVWGCEEGKGFEAFELIPGVRASIGICMDLNPYKFKAPFTDFEFSQHCFDDNVNLILCPMNWLHAKSPSIMEGISEDEKRVCAKTQQQEVDKIKGVYSLNATGGPIENYVEVPDYTNLQEPDYHNLNYWLLRFFPFMNHAFKKTTFKNRTTVVICNRTGVEDTITYGGTSSIVQFNGTSGLLGYNSIDLTNKSVSVLGSLGKGDEGILIRDVNL